MNQYILNGSAYLELGEVVGVVALPSPTAFYVDNKTYLLLESQTGFVKGLFYKCREVTPATDPKTYEWYVVNDEIGSLPTKIMDIWKAQNVLGAKNLLVFPYLSRGTTVNGITFTVNDDGSIQVNGTSTSFATLHIFRQVNGFKKGNYIISCEGLIQGVELQFGTVTDGTFVASIVCNATSPTKSLVIDSMYDDVMVGVRMLVQPDRTVDNVTVYPMLRLASDPDDTWTPYAPSNKDLYDMVRALQSGTTATTNRGSDENSDS